MLFNSIIFAIFLPLVFIFYWLLDNRSLKIQNFFLLLVSYIFYGWWDYRFLSLIIISSFVDYYVGLKIYKDKDQKRRKRFLLISIFVNLGVLGFFKYFNFFIGSFVNIIEKIGFQASPYSLRIILPVGISFYTFQTLSYTLDIYRKKLEPTKDIIAFFAFVSFFPQLVAGPIERAKHLLPQFYRKRTLNWENSKDGLRQILCGLVKKVIIADNLAIIVVKYFDSYFQYNSLTVALSVIYFAFQIYCDFSGYSDIAIGSAKLFGFDLMRNFNYPYFSQSIGEFWQRWHISLSSWFRDYVYIPLGGNRQGKVRQILNMGVTFVLSGLWHGASWTYVMWGAVNSLYYMPSIILSPKTEQKKRRWHRFLFFPIIKAIGVFVLICFSWIFFRSTSIQMSFNVIKHLFTVSWSLSESTPISPLYMIFALVIIEWLQRDKKHAFDFSGWPVFVRWPIYYTSITLIFLFGYVGYVPFIYFQF